MIWLTTTHRTSAALCAIRACLERELLLRRVHFEQEKREYNAHVTLARFPARKILPEKEVVSLPRIDPMQFNAATLDLMESHLRQSGSEYDLIVREAFADGNAPLVIQESLH